MNEFEEKIKKESIEKGLPVYLDDEFVYIEGHKYHYFINKYGRKAIEYKWDLKSELPKLNRGEHFAFIFPDFFLKKIKENAYETVFLNKPLGDDAIRFIKRDETKKITYVSFI
jgi:hypothetical protein